MIWLLTIVIAVLIVFAIYSIELWDEFDIVRIIWSIIGILVVGYVLLAISYGISAKIICTYSNGDSEYCVEEDK